MGRYPARRHEHFPRGAVGLQRFERRGCRFLERRRVFLDGGERFTDSRPEAARNLTECTQDVFLPRRLRLLVGENVAGRAVLCAQAEDVLAAERRDRPLQDRRARGPDADLLRDLRSQPRIRPAGSSTAAFFGCVGRRRG